MAGKKKKAADAPVAPEAKVEAAPAKGGFVVYDSNGKKFRVVEDIEQAKHLALVIGGRIK